MEWKNNKKYNPFNSYKLLAHIEKWEQIREGNSIPPPVLVSIDPINDCNMKCIWCNSERVLNTRKGKLDLFAINKITDFIHQWGVKAVCVGGGGESLVNPHTTTLILNCVTKNIEVGVVTNGLSINKHLAALSQCTWLGVSVDAATKNTFNKLKGVNGFDTVITNINNLIEYSNKYNTLLGKDLPAYGISFKYLVHKDNVHEIAAAAKLAKDLGCKNIHFRPATIPWSKRTENTTSYFSKADIGAFNQQISKALELDDANFNVYGVIHKFGDVFEPDNAFYKCWAIFMTAVFAPSITPKYGAFSFVLCCDRRGDPKLEAFTSITQPYLIKSFWGSKEHWDIHKSIEVETECPRCTYRPHNEIYETVILKDSMTYKFI